MDVENVTFNYMKLLEPIQRVLDSLSANTSDTDDAELYRVHVSIIVILAILYGSISVIAIIGNGLVIVVIARDKRMQTVTNIFIGNLAIADVIIGLFTTPFQFQPALLQRWDFPNFLCNLAPSVKILSVSVSVFTLTVISLDRYVAVIYPLKAGISKSSAFICLVVIWLLGIASCSPEGYFHSVKTVVDKKEKINKHFCRPDWPTDGFGKYYHIYLITVQYFLPLLVINFSYIRIACRIWGTKVPGNTFDRDNVRQRTRHKVVKMLIVVVILFVVCWMPYQLYNIVAEIHPDINKYPYINIIWFCCNWLAMSNSCYNPFIYGLLNEKFKREYRLLFSKSICVRKCSSADAWLNGNDSEEQNDTKRVTLTSRQGQSFRMTPDITRNGQCKYSALRVHFQTHRDDTCETVT